MKVIDPGHSYLLAHLDGEAESSLRFVKRVGDNFPGNQPPGYEGTTSQEVLRALIERQKYVQAQQPCSENQVAIDHLRHVLRVLELRAARVRDDMAAYDRLDALDMTDIQPEDLPVCPTCGHVLCKQQRHQP